MTSQQTSSRSHASPSPRPFSNTFPGRVSMTWGQETGNVRTLGYTPAVSQTQKQDHHLDGLRGDRTVHVSRWSVAGVSTGWRSPYHGTRWTDLCRQGSFLLQRGFFHYNIKGYLHYNILLSPFLLRSLFLLLRSPPVKGFRGKINLRWWLDRDKTDNRFLVFWRRTQWCVGVWITTVSEVGLNLILMDTYITIMM